MSAPALLHIEQASVAFGGVQALHKLSFSLQARGLYGIIGANGAGKSTLFNAISGITRLQSGSICHAGTLLTGLPAYRVARLGLARTFQNIRLLPQLSVLDNLLVATAVAREGTFWATFCHTAAAQKQQAQWLQRAEELLQAIGLWPARHTLAVTLPYGDQRRLEIARALMQRPRLLLLDEPAAGMNATEKTQLASLLQHLLQAETSCLIIEHDLSFIMQLCREVLVLHQGRLLTRGPPETLQHDPALAAHYF